MDGRVAVLGITLLLAASPAAARTVGLVADDDGDVVVAFDAETRETLGVVAVGPGLVGDCSITPDQSLGFVTDFNYQVWVVDLEADPPALAQPNPIVISNPGEDTAMTADGRHLLVCDGFGRVPVSVVDVAARAEVATFDLGSNCSAVDVCADGSVLAASSSTGKIHRLLLDEATGALTHTGEILDTFWIGSRGPNNVHCSPAGTVGVAVRRGFSDVMTFLVPGLVQADSRRLDSGGTVVAAAFPPGGEVVFHTQGGQLEFFAFDEATGALGASPRITGGVGPAVPFLGIDPIAVEPSSGELWVSEPAALGVVAPASGSKVESLQGAALSSPTGVCFAGASAEAPNAAPDCAAAVASVGELWPPRGNMEPVSVGGVTDPDGDPVALLVTGVHQDEPPSGRGNAECVDAYVHAADTVAVRAKRDGGGDGRVYHVAFEASDGRGGSCTGVVRVCVPVEPGIPCGDQGPIVDALAPVCENGNANGKGKGKK